MVTKSQKFLRNFRIPNSEDFFGEKFLGISSEFLKTESQNCDPTKIYHLRDQFWGIFREFPRTQLQERSLEKFFQKSHHGWRI